MNSVVETDNLGQNKGNGQTKNKDFQLNMLLAPAGATIKRLEREISVSEQGI
jgi:hypothetical protein